MSSRPSSTSRSTRKKIHLEHPIKALGEHEVELHLHPEVKTSMKVRVESDHPLPKLDAAAPQGKDDGKREYGRVTEKRGRRPDGKEEVKAEAKGKPEGKAKVEAKAKPEAKPKRVEKPAKE